VTHDGGELRATVAPSEVARRRRALLAVGLPGLGAVLAVRGLPSPGVALLGVVAAAAGAYAILALNDILTERPGALVRVGADERAARRAHPWRASDQERPRLAVGAIVALAVLCAVLAYILSPVCLLLVVVAAALHVARCLARSATVAVVAFGAACGIAGLAGWAGVAPISPRALPLVAFLGLWGVGCRIADDLAHFDIDGDRGAATIATVHGPITAARAGCVVGFATLAAAITLPLGGAMLNDIAVVLGVVVVAWPGARLWYRPSRVEAAAYHHSAMVYPAIVLLVALAPTVARAL
jgi:4-hydroxybenzoate polyprenyltransferase